MFAKKPFKKKPVEVTRAEIQKYEGIFKREGGSIEGILTIPNGKQSDELKQAIKFLTDKAGYVKRQKERGSTAKSTWKRVEQWAATFFGTKRVPLSGSNSGHNTSSDSLHPLIYIEAKYRNNDFAILNLFRDTEEKAILEKKIPLLVLKQKDFEGHVFVMRPEDLSLLSELKELSSSTDSLNVLEIVHNQSNGGRIKRSLNRKSDAR